MAVMAAKTTADFVSRRTELYRNGGASKATHYISACGDVKVFAAKSDVDAAQQTTL